MKNRPNKVAYYLKNHSMSFAKHPFFTLHTNNNNKSELILTSELKADFHQQRQNQR